MDFCEIGQAIAVGIEFKRATRRQVFAQQAGEIRSIAIGPEDPVQSQYGIALR